MNTTPLRLVLDPAGAELEAALACEAEVFLATYGNTPEEFEREYGPYAADTGFMTVLDECGLALATTRIIAPGPAGLKSLNDIAREPWANDGDRSARAVGLDPSRTWDIATIAVRRMQGRNPLCSAALYHGIVTAAQANGIESVVMIMDARARRLLSAAGLHPSILPGTGEGEYLGSARSTPLWANLDRLFDQQRRTDPDAYRLIYQGIGLDGITLPSDWTWMRPGERATSR
ncbi:hypothetical protein [Nocardioides sambongensis]|uniref:hypothetical protein n=1 Tax=Nocardioides sambongensis TaxID=2589074 RepID=UPI001128A1D8|nr:hypothetical protein [Nocardioides sambongensis]